MLWPSQEDVDANSVPVDQKTSDECVKWLRKLLKEDFLPNSIGKHLVAMDRWGTYWPKEKGMKRLDVLICRFEQAPYTVHIQESLAHVTVTVADERLEALGKGRSEMNDFILTTAKTVLNEDLLPTQDTRLFGDHYHESTDGKRAVYVLGWTLADSHKKGAFMVLCRTDGRFVMFHLYKDWGNVKPPKDVNVNRFGAG